MRQRLRRTPKLAAWVLDEKKAYRQIPIAPTQRKFSVVCLVHPDSRKLGYFIMIGHSFGLGSAVLNYNRRAAIDTKIPQKMLRLPILNYYDDKYGAAAPKITSVS